MENHEQIFQERVDELFCLEQKAEGRAEKLLEAAKDFEENLTEIKAASNSIQRNMMLCETISARATNLFWGSLLVSLIIIAGTMWWERHIDVGLTDSKAELARITTKLKHTPVILKYYGKDFVRVIPDTETSFTRGGDSEVPGRYAQVWHTR